MAEKTLAEIARDAWCTTNSPDDWQAVADAVVAEYEARRWRAWPPDDEQRKVHAWREDSGVFIARVHQDEEDGAERWFCGFGDDLSNELPTLWTPIPAPPKEAEHGR